MKIKKLFLLFVALLAATTLNADPGDHNPVILNPMPLDPINGDHPRSPILTPVFYLDGYTLTAADNTIGCSVALKDEDDNVVFSTYVSIEGDIQLPTTLSGTYTIEVTRGDLTFVGEIEL